MTVNMIKIKYELINLQPNANSLMITGFYEIIDLSGCIKT